MTVYETLNLQIIRMWCEANHYWPACLPGTPDRICIGGSPYAPEPEELQLIEWEDWYVAFNARQLKFVYNPSDSWFDLQGRNVRPD